MKLTILFESDEEIRRLERSFKSGGDIEDLGSYLRNMQRLRDSEFESDPVDSKIQRLRSIPNRWKRDSGSAAEEFSDFWGELYYDADRESMQYEIPYISNLITLYIGGEIYRTTVDGEDNEHVELIGHLSPESAYFFGNWPDSLRQNLSAEENDAELKFWTEFTNIVYQNLNRDNSEI